MTQIEPAARGETGFDQVLSFAIPDCDVRGRTVRLGSVLDEILSSHDYPGPIKNVLAEALVVTALMGSLMKDEVGQLTLQAQAEGGAIELLVCDYRSGELRGYAKPVEEKASRLGSNASLETIFGEGYLAVTFDLISTGQRYQGIVPLEGESLAAACEHYFMRSEQLPTLLRVAVKSSTSAAVAAGMLLQHMPEGEEGRERLSVKNDNPHWEHVAILGGTLKHEELLDPALSLEALVWRLYHDEEEVRISVGKTLSRGCRCTQEHYRDVLMRFPEDERAAMRNDHGLILVDCAFCSKIFSLAL